MCDDDRGLLSGTDESVRYFFKDEQMWLARVDHLDFTNNISNTEIFKIDSQISKFFVSIIKAKQNGTILKQFECSGNIE